MTLIDVKRFFSEKMDWNRITAECIQRKHIKLLRQIALHRKASITKRNLDLPLTTRHIFESRCPEMLHLRIDFVDADVISRTTVCCQRRRSESDKSDATASRGECIHRQADAAGFAVVSRRPCRSLGVDELQTVSDAAVLKQIMMFFRIIAP